MTPRRREGAAFAVLDIVDNPRWEIQKAHDGACWVTRVYRLSDGPPSEAPGPMSTEVYRLLMDSVDQAQKFIKFDTAERIVDALAKRWKIT